MTSSTSLPRLIGMVHLHPLPGSPGYLGDLDTIVEAATADAATLTDAGFDAIGVENFGDAPFYPDGVPNVTIPAMTAVITQMRSATELPVLVNVLRNDGLGALAVAAATAATMIRVNVLSGSMWTDQGLIHGRAADIARQRQVIAPHIRILADVFVKHATPPPGTELRQACLDLVERGGADGVVVSGSGTGSPPEAATLEIVRDTIGEVPLYVGSGITADKAPQFLEIADGAIVGTTLKYGGVTTNAVDPSRAEAFVGVAAGVERRG